MLVGRSVTDSFHRFDREMDCYFDKSRKYRCKLRSGTVLVVGPDDNLCRFLKFMVEQCSIPVKIVNIDDVREAKSIIEEMGERELKVVIMDTSMVDTKANGDSLPSWMDKNFPNVPIWVSNCKPEEVMAVKDLSARAGIVEDDDPISSYVDILGLPSKAYDMISRFAG